MPEDKLFAKRGGFCVNWVLSQDCRILRLQVIDNAGNRERLKTLPR